MTMLGAQLADLSGLSQRLTVTGSEIGTCQTNATTATNTVVDTVRQAATAALARIEGEMQSLRAAVTAAHSQATAAVWTGVNAETFRTAYAEFDQAMQQGEQATSETFRSFQANIDAMATELAEYSTRFAASMTDAQSSTHSMATAVEQQRANLDQVMNTGMAMG